MARNGPYRIPEFLNISPTDTRFPQYVNQACDRILKRGKYWGTYARYLVNATSQLWSPPPYIDTVERANVSKQPLPVHDLLYQFLDNGWGSRDDTLPNGSGVNELLVRGTYPTMVDVPAGGSKLVIRCDVALDAGQPVLVTGYDINGNWIRTLDTTTNTWRDGEVILMSQSPGTTSVNTFRAGPLVSIQLGTQGTPLNGQSWLTAQVDGSLLSNYQWFEFSPNYQRYLVPFVNSTVTTIEVIGKLAYIEAIRDSDYLTIGNLAAVKLGARAIKYEEEENFLLSSLLWEGGMDPKTKQPIIGVKQEMEYELRHFMGDGRQIGINTTGSGYGAMDIVEVVI
jgi:hypothetical protein